MARRFVFALMLFATACTDATFERRFAADFAPGRHAISVFGVYKNGQMTTAAWDAMSVRMQAALGGKTCEPGYTSSLQAANPALASAVEDYTRSNGPTDEFLTQIAPAALGDLVLVVTLAGKIPPKTSPNVAKEASTIGGGGKNAGRTWKSSPGSTDELDLSVSLFSVARSESVAIMSLRYTGQNADDATTLLAQKVAQSLPGSVCTGWNWSSKIDAERLRVSIDR